MKLSPAFRTEEVGRLNFYSPHCSCNFLSTFCESRALFYHFMYFQAHPKVADKLKENIEQWAEEFKNDPQLK